MKKNLVSQLYAWSWSLVEICPLRNISCFCTQTMKKIIQKNGLLISSVRKKAPLTEQLQKTLILTNWIAFFAFVADSYTNDTPHTTSKQTAIRKYFIFARTFVDLTILAFYRSSNDMKNDTTYVQQKYFFFQNFLLHNHIFPKTQVAKHFRHRIFTNVSLATLIHSPKSWKR